MGNRILKTNSSENFAEKILPSGEELISSVFKSVSAQGGKISAFSFEKSEMDKISGDDVYGRCSFSIYGCDNANAADAEYCVVSFRNNQPHFDMEIPFGEGKIKNPQKLNEKLDIARITNLLIELGSKLEGEHTNENKAELSFLISSEKLCSVLIICSENIEKSLWGEEKVLISDNGENCHVNILLMKNNKEENILSVCAKYAYLFGSELKIQPKKVKIIPQKLIFNKDLVAFDKRRCL